MGYILQNTSGLISTRITDVGRRKISQGSLNIQYFQVGDSEVSYTGVTNSVSTTSKILMPPYNAQNNTGFPQSTKNYIKYPYYMQGTSGNTYGIPYMESEYVSIYNTAEPRGFFSGDSTCWYVQPCSAYTINSEFDTDTTLLDGGILVEASSNPLACDTTANGTIEIGDLITIFYNQTDLCSCYQSCYPTLTYRVTYYDSGSNLIGLDRPCVNFTNITTTANSRLMVYPSGMTELYDTITPAGHWNDDVVNYESLCYTDQISSLIWNMNIIWSESIAGLNNAIYQDYNYYKSKDYIGTKEYLGYMSSLGQSATTDVYYYNSYNEKILVTPEEQKSIAVIHFTNQSINNFYGEKFAVEEYDVNSPGETGQARNFKLHIPTVMWHKGNNCCSGETFYIDPPVNGGGFMEQGLLLSSKNSDMNNPGIRYYTLWDNHLTSTGLPSRIGKVFPDDQLVVIDDPEIIATLSYKSNRNWTLPAPKLTLTAPNICNGDINSDGVLSAETETLWVSYGFYNNSTFTSSLHCQYYQQIIGPTSGCTNYSMDVSLIFGNEFGCMNTDGIVGFVAEEFYVIAQKVTTGDRPNPNLWKEIDFTDQLSGYTVNGYITPQGLTASTFTITSTLYDNAPTHDMGSVLYLPTVGSTGELNFGDEYYFYGNIETDIQATIYEMKYRINLPSGMFMNSSNPSWNNSLTPYFNEIGLYDSENDLIFISKMQRPTQRSGIQQIMIKYDF
jgi:hypothetical protein